MIYTLKDKENRRELICDNSNELLNYDIEYLLPGSTAYSASDQKKYILSADKKWVDRVTCLTLDGSQLSGACVEYITDSYNKYRYYLCNTENDIFDIPVNKDRIEPGSLVEVIAIRSTFILGPDYEWYDKTTGQKKERIG